MLPHFGLITGAQSSTISWDHFFLSINQYYSSLRQEAPLASDMAHIYRHHHRGITPQEVEGLMAVLKLVETVAEYVSVIIAWKMRFLWMLLGSVPQ